MKRKLFTGIILFSFVLLSMGAAKQNDEIKRMGIFISNFTEQGLFEFDIYDGSDDEGGRLMHLGYSENMPELVRFGIQHNVINNPKSTIKKCTRKNCPYGDSVMSAKSVANAVKKYFDMDIENVDSRGDYPEFHFDGTNYHFNRPEWTPERVYYADVQDVERSRNIITMRGEIYDLHNKKDRPASFEAKAKPYKWNNKDTWAIISLVVDWYE